jgi:hypothetical protein
MLISLPIMSKLKNVVVLVVVWNFMVVTIMGVLVKIHVTCMKFYVGNLCWWILHMLAEISATLVIWNSVAHLWWCILVLTIRDMLSKNVNPANIMKLNLCDLWWWITNSMVQSPSWEANSHSVSQDIPYLMEPEGLLLCSQWPTISHFPESHECSPNLPTLFL